MSSEKTRLRSIPTPKCCDAQKKHPTIRALCADDDDGNFSENTPVKWYIRPLIIDSYYLYNGNPFDHTEITEPKFCPFCGKALPELIKKNKPPKNVCVVTDGGYYCDTCKERLDNCKCYPPEARWRVRKVNRK